MLARVRWFRRRAGLHRELCLQCGHEWTEHLEVCSECVYEIEHGQPGRPPDPCHRQAALVDEEPVDLLVDRHGAPSQVILQCGAELTVFNIAWGYDQGEVFAHVTTNISPEVEGASKDFFFTHEVAQVIDPTDGRVLFA
jgi:hypothetical protein